MTLKKNGLLISFLLLAGMGLLQGSAFAGHWAIEYASVGGYNSNGVYIPDGTHETPSPWQREGAFHQWPYSNDPNSYCKWLLPYNVASRWIDPHIDRDVDVWGDIDDIRDTHLMFSSIDVTASGTITPGFRWVPDDENDAPPQKVWVKYATGIMWLATGPTFTVSAKIHNPIEDRYSSFSLPDDMTQGWSNVGAWSYGVKCEELNVTSGFASAQVSLSLYMTCADIINDAHYQVYLYACTLDEAPSLPSKKPIAPWRNGAPHCCFTSVFNPSFHPRIGGTKSGGDPVDVATGAHLELPDPDITAYNPFGPNAVYQRNYLSLRAEDGYSSPGLSDGWVDNYDVKIVGTFSDYADKVSLVYPNGAEDTLYGGFAECGALTTEGYFPIDLRAPMGAPYFVTSVPSETPKRWESITLTFKDRTQWTFTTEDGVTYYLSSMSNGSGRHISIIRDANNGNRVSSVTDDSAHANDLLSFHYDGANLSYISDAYGRKVTYTFGTAADTTCLLSVSQLASASAASPSPLEQYGYSSIAGHPHITSISAPSPTGSGKRTESINYDTLTGMVSSLVDANGNQCVFTYDGYNGRTGIQIKDPQGVVAKEWTERYDPANGNVSRGSADAEGRVSTLMYNDWQNSGLPTSVIDRQGKTTFISYDQFGNVLSVEDTKGTWTTYTYDYPSEFPLGRLVSIQQGSKAPTNFTWYEPSGLLHTITIPKPGTTGGSETVTTTFSYDGLGNVLTKEVPGNPDNQTITYNYTQDGTYTQPAKLGQPLTVTDGLGHVTHYRYDDRGNAICTIDALGNRTDFTYNIADQLVTTINPSTSAP